MRLRIMALMLLAALMLGAGCASTGGQAQAPAPPAKAAQAADSHPGSPVTSDQAAAQDKAQAQTAAKAIAKAEAAPAPQAPADAKAPATDAAASPATAPGQKPDAQKAKAAAKDDDDPFAEDDPFADAEASQQDASIPDPLEPYNRLMFAFNDAVFRDIVTPVAKGYKAVMPWEYRTLVKNFFHNLFTPLRVIAALAELKFERAGMEAIRFLANSTVGILGMGDPAEEVFGWQRPPDEDLGQALAHWGVPHGFYIIWPFLGPSSLRDSVDPLMTYFVYSDFYNIASFDVMAAIHAYRFVNAYSFRIGDYESLTDAAIDPYIAMRNFYVQYRKKITEE